MNRELSWLDFNRRVLALAEDPALPPLERIKFLAIFSQNLDEFFQVRVGGLHQQRDAGVEAASPDGRTPAEQLREIRSRVLELTGRQQDVMAKDVLPRLADAGIRVCRFEDVGKAGRRHLGESFERHVFPVLTPLVVDPAHPFPHISNLSLNLAILVREPASGELRFARVKVPPNLPRFLVLPNGECFVPIEQVIAAHLEQLVPGMEIESHDPFRVTLNADLAVEEEEAPDLLEAIESGLRRRLRGNAPARLEAAASMSDQVRELLREELELQDEDVYVVRGALDLAGLWQLYSIDRPDLKEEAWTASTQPRLQTPSEPGVAPDLFETIREADLLVHHPYDSFETSVESFLRQAADDPRVLAIKHTLYRTSGPENPIVGTLVRAAEAGKQVVTLVELKARFDERANIDWARTLERAGVHVVYGMVGLKTHAKVSLVVREEEDGLRRYVHVATGNYNPQTARLYEDLGVFSSDPDLGADLTELFNHLTAGGRPTAYRKLWVAPDGLREGLLREIRREARAPDGRIVLKANGLSDPELIEALYDASQAGVEIDLVIRGICCLRPGVPGLSERIRVRSILGRFLEHSRVFRFGSEARGQRYFLGSADLMPRNLDDRVEAVAPVEDAALRARLEEMLRVILSDDVQAWELQTDGSWTRVATLRGVSTHARLQRLAQHRARTALDGLHGSALG